MDSRSPHPRFLPSAFDLATDFHFVEIAKDTPWPALTEHLLRARPRAVFGLFPEKLQLDVRVYEAVRAIGAPYMSCNPRNIALACELIRQLHVDLVVATRAEALALVPALGAAHISVRSWHLILSPEEISLPVPTAEDVVVEAHRSPGIPL